MGRYIFYKMKYLFSKCSPPFVLLLIYLGKTRTKEKYRVVYTDHQRLELEKEFHFNRYITIRRKSELAVNLGLSERQVRNSSFITLLFPFNSIAGKQLCTSSLSYSLIFTGEDLVPKPQS